MNEQSKSNSVPVEEMSAEERIAYKYEFIKEKIILNFNKGCRILKISKITVAVLFVLFTLAAVVISNRSGNRLQWLQTWILVIFANIFIFVPADYAKYLIESKVIPYLNDDEQVEFGEYDIFVEDLDNPHGEDESEED
ncbi:MAG: hypothetical protein IKI33_05680 [Eubacterium sp.]|nr:hypothetical protein [Eubacterium sp.]